MSSDEVRQVLRGYFDLYPDASFSFGGRMGPMASGDINILIQGDDLDDLMTYAEAAKELIEEKVPT